MAFMCGVSAVCERNNPGEVKAGFLQFIRKSYRRKQIPQTGFPTGSNQRSFASFRTQPVSPNKMKNLSKKIMVTLPLVVAMLCLGAQPARFPIRMNQLMLNSTVSGNGFGVQRNPALGVSIGKRLVICAGPVFDRDFRKNTGALISSRYFLVRDDESYNGHFRLSAILSLQRMHNQSLSPNALACEQMEAFNMKNDESARFSELRYKGWEASAGVGCSYQFGFGMILRADVGMCYFNTTQQTHQEINSFRDENSSSLRLGLGIGWTLHREHFTPRASSAAMARAVQTGE